jgi:tetratricopeptide (TPR) repeat protein
MTASSSATSPRLEKMRKLLEKAPNDAFLHYGVALELKNLNDFAGALTHLARTLEIDPGYLYAYYQQGQILELADRPDDAKPAYDAGIERAKSVGDQKALNELRAARNLLD